MPLSTPSRALRVSSASSAVTIAVGIGAAVLWSPIAGIAISLIAFAIFILTRLAMKGHTHNPGSNPATSTADQLKRELYNCQYLDHVEIEGQKLYNQFEEARTRFANFKSTLDSKFEKTEVTYGRYFNVAEQAYLAILDNCRKSVPLLKQMSSIDLKSTKRSHQTLSEQSPQNEMELQALKSRMEFYEQAQNQFQDMMSLNQKALTEFDHLTSRLNEIQTQQGLASADLDQILEELSVLAERAQLYNKK